MRNTGKLLPLHPGYSVSIIRPESAVFATFFNSIRQQAAFRELTWVDTLPAVERTCETQQVVVVLIDETNLPQFAAEQAALRNLVATHHVVLVFFGIEPADTLIPRGTAALRMPDAGATAQAMSVQALFGAVDVPMPNGRVLTATRLGHAPPELVGIQREKLEKIDALVNKAIRQRAMPGCQVLVAKSGKIVYDKTFGYHTYDKEQPVGHEDVYDLASITKVAATTLGVMLLQEEGKLELSGRIRDYMTRYDRSGLKYLKVQHLLSHHSGLQENLPIMHWLRRDDLFYTERTDEYPTQVGKQLYLKAGVSEDLTDEIKRVRPPKHGFYKYSDVNFLLLQQLVEHQTGYGLETLMANRIYGPLGLHRLQFLPGVRLPDEEIVPTEVDKRWRKGLVHGEVHDESAMLLGGVAGHAGLFSNARDVATVFQMLLNGGKYGGKRFLQAATVAQYTHRNGANYRGYGFDRIIGHSNALRRYGASDDTFGHTGFTGTCVWADPEHDLIFIFLSNRIYPNKDNDKLMKLGVRERIHQLIYQSLGSARVDV
jgi:CubicO group peptidase (beta-lactamase class C family)